MKYSFIIISYNSNFTPGSQDLIHYSQPAEIHVLLYEKPFLRISADLETGAVDFFRRARKQTKIYLLKGKVITSARRFLEDGLIMHQIKNAYYLLQFIWEIHPDKIALKYDYLQKRRIDPFDSDI